ncbi:MAG: class I SAM-dependent methyltransferase [Methanoregula sp.]|jgi:SAM-dependent methyltransferase|nr:class I SAM-dependent methyltransferase [Methanoregula sp.]
MTDNRIVWDDAYQRRWQIYGGSAPPVEGLLPCARVLELGCGNGKNTGSLLQQGCDVIALDFSRVAVMAARSVISGTLPGHAVLADARTLPLSSGSCDAVIARHIIGHMNHAGRMKIAAETARVLKAGGTLHFFAFSCEDFRYGQGVPVEKNTFLRGNGISTHYFSPDEVPALFSSLFCRTLTRPTWCLRIRGRDYVRAEIHAVFTRSES